MTVRVPVSPAVLAWALDATTADPEGLRRTYAIDDWLSGTKDPTLTQLEGFARQAGIGFGYLLLPQPPSWTLPVPDFREGLGGAAAMPSPDLLAVLSQSQRRQDWYRDHVLALGQEPLEFVGAAAEREAETTAAEIRAALDFEVDDRRGGWNDARKHLLQAFERLGGLTVTTSMVANNTHRPLDEAEFRGFALLDDLAPLVFVNATQTLNGQLFTLVHEIAHVWRGTGGLDDQEPSRAGQSEIERWCNSVASEVLAPRAAVEAAYAGLAGLALPDALDALATELRCGTLVVLQALRRYGLRQFDDFAQDYDIELARLRSLASARPSGGGDFYANQPFRVGERFSRAVIADALEGGTDLQEAMRLLGLRSLSSFDAYARSLQVV